LESGLKKIRGERAKEEKIEAERGTLKQENYSLKTKEGKPQY